MYRQIILYRQTLQKMVLMNIFNHLFQKLSLNASTIKASIENEDYLRENEMLILKDFKQFPTMFLKITAAEVTKGIHLLDKLFNHLLHTYTF